MRLVTFDKASRLKKIKLNHSYLNYKINMEIQCIFYKSHDNSQSRYVCYVKKVKIISLEKGTVSIYGTHEKGFSNHDVTGIYFKDKISGFIPRNLGKILPNLKHLTMICCGLEKLMKKSFQGLANLEYIDFAGNHLKRKSFKRYFQNNKLERMRLQLLLPIEHNLVLADFRNNAKINDWFYREDASYNDLVNFKRSIDFNCLLPEKMSEKVERLMTFKKRVAEKMEDAAIRTIPKKQRI